MRRHGATHGWIRAEASKRLAQATAYPVVLVIAAALIDRVGRLAGRPRRWRYLEHLPKHGIGAEIGVFRGEFATHLLRIARPRELHLIDGWWTIYGDTYPNWGTYTEFGTLRTRQAYDEVRARVAGAPVQIHVGDDRSVLAKFPQGFFDWVYLDTSHKYEHTLEELTLLHEKVRVGGVIMGDDWKPDPGHVNHGVYRAVNELRDRFSWELGQVDRFGQWYARVS
jgi:hypothetical protein